MKYYLKASLVARFGGFGQTHDVKNLFIADGGLFTESSEKSPTVTIMALTLREADYLADEFQRGSL